jgi:hypothetical protein
MICHPFACRVFGEMARIGFFALARLAVVAVISLVTVS